MVLFLILGVCCGDIIVNINTDIALHKLTTLISWDVFSQLQQLADERDTSLDILVEELLKHGLEDCRRP